jgi:hypothetical protein
VKYKVINDGLFYKPESIFQLGGKGKGMCPKKMKNKEQNCPKNTHT